MVNALQSNYPPALTANLGKIALKSQDPKAVDLYFSQGGTVEKLTRLAKQLKLKQLNADLSTNALEKKYKPLTPQEKIERATQDLFAPSNQNQPALLQETTPNEEKAALTEGYTHLLIQTYQQKNGLSKTEIEQFIKNCNLSIPNMMEHLIKQNQKGLIELIAQINKTQVINSQDVNETTPLIHAVQNNQTDLVDYFIKNGAPIDQRDKHGRTPLRIACQSGFADCVDLLLQNNGCNKKEGARSLTLLDKAKLAFKESHKSVSG